MKIRMPFFLACVSFFILTTKPMNYQHHVGKQNDPTYLFCAPIHFTRNGIQYYLQTVFNDPSYVQNFLPYSMSHFTQFLEHAHSTKQTKAFMEYSLRLFCNKIKAAPYISALAFSDMLEKIPNLLKGYAITTYEEIDFSCIKNSIKNTLYDMFLNRFALFKQEPEKFLDDLSHDLVKKVETIYALEERIAQERLVQMLLRFLDITTLKLMWTPHDQIYVWDSVKKIANQFADLLNQGIINRDELDDLYRSLIERFCYFLDLSGSELSTDVIQKMKEDVAASDILLFSLEEQEDLIETRAERMMNALIQTEAKIEAKKYGMITDVLVYDGK